MKTKIWTGMFSIYIIWGSTYLAIRYVVETIPPFFSAGLRFLAAALIVLTWRKLAGDPWPTPRQWRDASIVGLLLLLGGNGLVSWAEQSVPSGITALIIGSMPLWMVTIESLRPGGTRPTRQVLAGVTIGFGGIALLVGPGVFGGDGMTVDLAGAGALLIATLLWALGSVYSRGADLPQSSIQATGMEMLAGSIGLFAVSGLTGEFGRFDPAAVSSSSWLGLAYLVVFGSLVAFVAYAWLLRNAPVSLVSTYAYVNPVVAILLGAWIAGEALNLRIALAAGIILGAVLLINTARQARAGAKETLEAPASD
jgi:drug/metabolite transporter (DMT)-like permease